MIRTKKDLKYYLKCDKVALKIPKNRFYPRPIFDAIWKYEILLRYAEYYKNSKCFFKKIYYVFYKIRLQKLGNILNIYIPLNTFGPGLSIAHYGNIIVNDAAKIGCNCRIHEGVTIGATNGCKDAAKIGDNCFIGSGAKIIGDVKIASNVAIGAGAVVIKNVEEASVTVAGVPAKIVSNNGSLKNIIEATKIVDDLYCIGGKN